MNFLQEGDIIRKLLVIIITIFFLISFFLIYDYFKNNKKILYAYQIDQHIDYKVNLFDNSFIDDTTLGKNEMYITELVKDIDINFKYNFLGSKNIDLNYNYEIKGTIISKYTNDQKTIWTKEYQLLDLVITKDSNINEKIYIDFNKYLNEVVEFTKSFSLANTTIFNIEFIVSVNGNIDDEIIEDKKISTISIPLGIQVFSIKEDYIDKDNKDIVIKKDNYYFIIPLVINLILFLIFYKKIFNIKTKTKYVKRLNRILKNYNNVIIETETKINYKNYKKIKVKNIDELIDLEEELQIPINLYINKNKAEFTLINNNLIYIYVLKE